MAARRIFNLGWFFQALGDKTTMAEVLEDHVRLHLLGSEKNSDPPHELAEDLLDLVRAYLK